MSLFGSIFKQPVVSVGASDLFSENSRFKASHEASKPKILKPPSEDNNRPSEGKRKRHQTEQPSAEQTAVPTSSKKSKKDEKKRAELEKKKIKLSQPEEGQETGAKEILPAAAVTACLTNPDSTSGRKKKDKSSSKSDEEAKYKEGKEEAPKKKRRSERVANEKPYRKDEANGSKELIKPRAGNKVTKEPKSPHVDKSEEMKTAGSSGREATEKLARTIFVGNVPLAVKRKALSQLFSQYGMVESVRLRSVPIKVDAKLPRKAAVASGAVDTARGSAHAYVVFSKESEAVAATAHNMQEWKGVHLRVDMAGVNKLQVKAAAKTKGQAAAAEIERQGPQVQYESRRSVFLGNVHVEAEDEEVIRFLMEGLGAGAEEELQGVRVVRDSKTSVGKGIAFALFKSPIGRKAALALDGRLLRGRPVRVMPVSAGPKGAGSSSTKEMFKKKAAWQGETANAARFKNRKSSPRSERLRRVANQGKTRVTKRPAVAARKAKRQNKL